MEGDFNGRYILDEAGNVLPCPDLLEWAQWYETSRDRCKVACEQVGDYFVSTIFLTLDHDYSGRSATNDPLHYRPVLWETMVFNIIGGIEEMWRYRSREAALTGHKVAVERMREVQERQESQLKNMQLENSENLMADQHSIPENDRESPEGHAYPAERESRRSGHVESGEHEANEREHHEDQGKH
jgi:hypothetical protein